MIKNIKYYHSSFHLNVVLKFNIEGFRQQQTETSSSNRGDAIYQHGDGVMEDLQEPDQWREDARHTGAHGVETDTILPASIDNGLISNHTACNNYTF